MSTYTTLAVRMDRPGVQHGPGHVIGIVAQGIDPERGGIEVDQGLDQERGGEVEGHPVRGGAQGHATGSHREC